MKASMDQQPHRAAMARAETGSLEDRSRRDPRHLRDAGRATSARPGAGACLLLATVVFIAACGEEESSRSSDLPRTVEAVEVAELVESPEAQAQALLEPGIAGRHLPAFHYDGSLRDAIEFFLPHSGGNGRSCATCHRPEDQFALTPATVEARWQALQKRRRHDPAADDPLFRAIDADDFKEDFTTLRTKAMVRVQVPLPPNVRRADDPAARSVSLFRAVPTVINGNFTAPFQNDGSEATLESQARSAMRTHSEVTDEPPEESIARLASFQRHLFSSVRVMRMSRALDAGAPPPSADPPLNALERAGRATFETFCATCHGGATQTKNSDARFLPVPGRGPIGQGGEAFVNIFVSTPRPPPPGLPPPAQTPRFFDGLPTAGLPDIPWQVDLPNGATAATVSSDPGRGLITGDLREFGRFDVPTLFGAAGTAPYFHDNSAPDLDAVIELYQAMFRFMQHLDVEGGFFAPASNGQGCERGTCGFRPIPEAEIAGLKAYLERLGR